MCYLVSGPLPCPEVVAVFYIRPAKVPTLFSVKGDAQVEQQNTVVGFLTSHLRGFKGEGTVRFTQSGNGTELAFMPPLSDVSGVT